MLKELGLEVNARKVVVLLAPLALAAGVACTLTPRRQYNLPPKFLRLLTRTRNIKRSASLGASLPIEGVLPVFTFTAAQLRQIRLKSQGTESVE